MTSNKGDDFFLNTYTDIKELVITAVVWTLRFCLNDYQVKCERHFRLSHKLELKPILLVDYEYVSGFF